MSQEPDRHYQELGIDILVLTYHSNDDVSTFWQRIVRENLPGWNFYFHDNGGTEEALRLIEGLPNVSVTRGENVGFARGINYLVSASTSDYLAIINPDVSFGSELLMSMLETMSSRSDIAVLGPRLYKLDMTGASDARQIPTLKDIAARRMSEVRRDRDGVVTAGWLSGAFMVWRRREIEALQGFDEQYFMFWEDVDLCHRARSDSVWVDNSIHAIHRVGGSHKMSPAAKKFSRESRRHYAKKMHGWPGFGAAIIAETIEVVKPAVDFLRRRE